MQTMPTKLVQIASTNPDKSVMVEIAPDDTASAVLEKAGLDSNRFWLMKPGDQADYAPTEMPYCDVSEGNKLHVLANSVVGVFA